jgi:LPXTG-motif cell wall-anchored protein
VNRPIKRLLAIAGAATVGFFGSVVLASPAQAHHPIISGEAVCQANGTYEITWKVGNGNWGLNRQEKILEITTNPNTAISGFAVGTMIPASSHATGTQTVPGTTTEATLKIKARWYESNGTTQTNIFDTKTGKATGVNGRCVADPDPTATFLSKCDGSVNVHISNPGRAEATFKVTAGDFTKDVVIGSGDEADVVVPAGNGKVTVSKGGDKVAESDGWARPEDCPAPTGVGEFTCDSFWVKVTNPQGGQPVDATVTYGTQVKNVTVAPGKTEAVELQPSSTGEAVIEFAGWPGSTAVKYEKPADCPGLPQTGDNTAGFIAAGTGFVGLGAVVFFLARRRMVQLRRLAS